MRTRYYVLSLALLSFFILSCTEESPIKTEPNTTSDSSKRSPGIEIKLTDAPGDYKEVNIYLDQIQVLTVDSADSKWVDLTTNSGYYDLLKLQNGVDTTIVKDSLSKGTMISQLRMILADSNNVLVDTNYHSLFVPSGTQTGFKINLKDTMSADSLKITIDFDADNSVVEQGNGRYLLKPVLRIK